MPNLDIPTLNILPIVVAPLHLALLWLMHRAARGLMKGSFDWFLGIAFLSSGLFLRSFMGHVYSWLSIDIANGLIIGGFLYLLRGFYRYSNRSFPTRGYLAAYAVTMGTIMFFNHASDNIAARIVAYNAMVIVVLADIVRLAMKHANISTRYIRWFAALPVLFFVGISVVRLISITPHVFSSTFTEQQSGAGVGFHLLSIIVMTWAVVSYAILVADRLSTNLADKITQLNGEKRSSDMLYGLIAHDLAGPMKAIVNLLDVMQDNNYIEKRNINSILGMMHETAFTTHDLLRKLLMWTEFRHGSNILKENEVGLRSVMEENLALYRLSINEKQIAVESDIAGDLKMTADANLVAFVMRNLISNAIQFSPQSGTIRITASVVGDMVACSVTDDGPGFDGKVLAMVESGAQTDPDFSATGDRGSGVGLRMCRELLGITGGFLTIEGRQGAKTTVSFGIKKSTWRSSDTTPIF